MDKAPPWDEIARLYRDLSVPIAGILVRYGLSQGELRKAARARRWPARGVLKSRSKSGRTKTAAPASKPRAQASHSAVEKVAEKPEVAPAKRAAPAIKPLALVKRVYNTIDKELSKLEEHAGKSSQDRERASRALSQMVSSLEKAHEMQREITKDEERKGAKGKDKEALKNAEEMRREIAERLERLQRKRAAAK